jgi:hypothetical protein
VLPSKCCWWSFLCNLIDIIGNTASAGAGGLFSTPASSQAFGGTSAPNFGGASAPAFGSNLFSSSMSGSIFAQTNPTGSTQSLVCHNLSLPTQFAVKVEEQQVLLVHAVEVVSETPS